MEAYVLQREFVYFERLRFEHVDVGNEGFTGIIPQNMSIVVNQLAIVRRFLLSEEYALLAGLNPPAETVQVINAREILNENSVVIVALLAEPEIQIRSLFHLDAAIYMIQIFRYHGVFLASTIHVLNNIRNFVPEFQNFRLLPPVAGANAAGIDAIVVAGDAGNAAVNAYVEQRENAFMAEFDFVHDDVGLEGFTANIEENLASAAEQLEILRGLLFRRDYAVENGFLAPVESDEVINARQLLQVDGAITSELLAEPEIQIRSNSHLVVALNLLMTFDYPGTFLASNIIVLEIIQEYVPGFNNFRLLPHVADAAGNNANDANVAINGGNNVANGANGGWDDNGDDANGVGPVNGGNNVANGANGGAGGENGDDANGVGPVNGGNNVANGANGGAGGDNGDDANGVELVNGGNNVANGANGGEADNGDDANGVGPINGGNNVANNANGANVNGGVVNDAAD